MLVQSTLEHQIKTLLDDLENRTDNREQAKIDFSRQLATIITNYIKTATVTVNVTTVGSATTQTGTGTGTLQ